MDKQQWEKQTQQIIKNGISDSVNESKQYDKYNEYIEDRINLLMNLFDHVFKDHNEHDIYELMKGIFMKYATYESNYLMAHDEIKHPHTDNYKHQIGNINAILNCAINKSIKRRNPAYDKYRRSEKGSND